MAEEEEQIEEEEEEEEEEGEAEEQEEPAEPIEEKKKEEPKKEEPEPEAEEVKLRRAPIVEKEPEPEQLTEAALAMLAAKKRHEEEEAAKQKDYEEKRREEKQRIEEELRELREKRDRRIREREEEEREFAQRAKEIEEKRKIEEDSSKARLEQQKLKREEERKKRQEMAGSLGAVGGAEGPNYVINKRDKDEFGSIAKKMEPSANDKAEAKEAYVAAIGRRRMNAEDMLENDLRKAIHALHERICKLEAEKYDLEKRHERQDYDLKELHEREKQVARNKALQRGLDPNEAVASSHPPKVNVASKFDRQIDRRSYTDRRTLYESPIMKKAPKLVRGTARPPPEWGRSENEELEQLRKILEPFRYVEQVKIEDARPPVEPIPLSIPEPEEEETSSPPTVPAKQAPQEAPEVEAAEE